jgi:dipeptidyl aminopeptidase/acylaminoacyl peptidase
LRTLLLTAFYLLESFHSSAQIRVIDSSAIFNWPKISSECISNNGQYVAYKLAINKHLPILVLQHVDGSRNVEIPGVLGNPEFSENSQWLIFRHSQDSIGVMNMLNDSLEYVEAAGDYSISIDQWIAIRTANSENGLLLFNLNTNKKTYYTNVRTYIFSNSGRVIVLQKERNNDTLRKDTVIWHNLQNGEDTNISRVVASDGFVFDPSGTKLSFYSSMQLEHTAVTNLLYYQSGMDSAQVVFATPELGDMAIMQEEPFFSTAGDKLFFYIGYKNAEDLQAASPGGDNVTVLMQFDDSLQFMRKRTNRYLSVVDLKANKRPIIRLQQDKDIGFSLPNGSDQNYVVVASRNILAGFMDYSWRPSAIPDIYLVSVRDGSRVLIKQKLISGTPLFSPTDKYVIWFDKEQKNWFAYNIRLGILKNITHRIPTPIYFDNSPDYPYPAGILGWMANDESVLVYGRNDIWKVDPTDKVAPIDITGAYGKKNDISFRFLNFTQKKSISLQYTDELLLTAFDYKNKENGFFQLPLYKDRVLQHLTMEPRLYYFPGIGSASNISGDDGAFHPLKAKNCDIYIVKRTSSAEYPNLFVTTDFRDFKSVTQFIPQKGYNWYQSELCHWKLLDGTVGEGILYKPNNFDPAKKYPVIFYYYEKNADLLHSFINPELSDGILNIPWFVSNGYIVVMPNIYYKSKNPGAGVYNSIMAAANYILHKPWVDFHHMGLQGHSFGGWETNYIITHCALFAAAAVSSGNTDIIRYYEDELPGGYYNETGQGRMGSNLWDNPKAYIDNSPIFRANKVTTPVLIMHNPNDRNIDYKQGYQWYNALTRLGKKAWMLSYKGEGHTIEEESNQLDYTIRLTQFFDYFLKGCPPPKWMTKGKDPVDINRDYELDKVQIK